MPSTTESLFDLGIGLRVVGITDYCIHPAEAVKSLPRVGGPKNPRIEDILSLQPDLVLANWEENNRRTIEQLEINKIPVWVTFPQTIKETLEFLWALASLFHSRTAPEQLKSLESGINWARAAASSRPEVKYFCPIWFERSRDSQGWFMTFNHQTYCHDLLSVFGGKNSFADRVRRYPLAADLGALPGEDPGERDTRYPRVSFQEVMAADPELILLPDEPFAFGEAERREIISLFDGCQAVKTGKVFLVEGGLITWHGTRLGKALQEIPFFFN